MTAHEYETWEQVQGELFKDFPQEKLDKAKDELQEGLRIFHSMCDPKDPCSPECMGTPAEVKQYVNEINEYNWNSELEGDKMNLTDLAHQCFADSKAWFPEKATDLVHQSLGLAGEAGEVANWAKKIDRGTTSLDDEGVRKAMGEEVIDVLIYALSLCAILGINPDEMWKLKRAKNQQRFGKKEDSNGK